MAQAPKHTILKGDDGLAYWHREAANGDITSNGGQGFRDRTDALRAIRDDIETAIAAAGISISIGTPFEPIVEYIGWEEPTPEPGPEGPYPEQTTESQPDGQDQSTENQEEVTEESEPED